MTTATAPSPTSTGPEGLLATASPLPLGAEWQQALGLAAAAVVQPQPAYEGNLCQTPEAGSRRETQRVVGRAAQPDATLLGVQTRYTFVSDTAARAGVAALAQGIASCAAPVSPRERTTSSAAAHPRIWSYTKDGATGWLAVAQYGTSVAWLEVSADAPEAATVDQADMATLADIAYQRLRLYGAPAAPKPGITTPPPRAVDEDMPVTGASACAVLEPVRGRVAVGLTRPDRGPEVVCRARRPRGILDGRPVRDRPEDDHGRPLRDRVGPLGPR